MSKIISAYRNFTAAVIKSRADIPDQSDMTVDGSDVECDNINTTKIRNAISAGTNKLSELSTHANINHWSGFGPTKRTATGGLLVNSVEAPHGMGEFAGYNHSAPTPAFSNSAHLDDIWIISGGDAEFAADICISEPKYIGGDISNKGDCVGIALTVWDGSSLVGYGIEDLEDYDVNVSLSAIVPDVTAEKTYTCKIYLVNSLVTFNQNGENITCQIPGLENYNTTVKILLPTELNLSGAAGWTLVGEGINLPNATFSLTSFYRASGDAPDLVHQIRLVKQIDSSEEITQVWTGDYYEGTTIYPSPGTWVIHFETPLPSYGYTAYLEFVESS